MLVWKAMPSITPMISPMRRLEASMPDMVPTTCSITSPLRLASFILPAAASAAWLAPSVVLATVALISSIADAVSSRLAAACSVR